MASSTAPERSVCPLLQLFQHIVVACASQAFDGKAPQIDVLAGQRLPEHGDLCGWPIPASLERRFRIHPVGNI